MRFSPAVVLFMAVGSVLGCKEYYESCQENSDCCHCKGLNMPMTCEVYPLATSRLLKGIYKACQVPVGMDPNKC
ncbi:hypothetical protein IAQ61_000642 [Plenodomus lingam]|uniref:uncharacterized protein n=1 Tax=Leptosphaeria maculans TaxID=5022 RepID=UPI0033344CF5|nr:hypothetical protein IAQ61_000642 [Plenodomus lingam]